MPEPTVPVALIVLDRLQPYIGFSLLVGALLAVAAFELPAATQAAVLAAAAGFFGLSLPQPITASIKGPPRG